MNATSGVFLCLKSGSSFSMFSSSPALTSAVNLPDLPHHNIKGTVAWEEVGYTISLRFLYDAEGYRYRFAYVGFTI